MVQGSGAAEAGRARQVMALRLRGRRGLRLHVVAGSLRRCGMGREVAEETRFRQMGHESPSGCGLRTPCHPPRGADAVLPNSTPSS